MFGRTLRRENRRMLAEIDLLKRQLRAARLDCGEERREKAEWSRRADRFGSDRIASEKRATQLQITAAQLSVQLADWSSHAVDQAELFTRAMRARGAESRRLRAVIARQQGEVRRAHAEVRDMKERLAAQERQLEILQAANEQHYRDLTVRPAKTRVQRARRLDVA